MKKCQKIEKMSKNSLAWKGSSIGVVHTIFPLSSIKNFQKAINQQKNFQVAQNKIINHATQKSFKKLSKNKKLSRNVLLSRNVCYNKLTTGHHPC